MDDCCGLSRRQLLRLSAAGAGRQPPRGELLCTVALSNDLHIGETVSGLATAAFPPGFSQAPGLPPYPVVMTSSMTADQKKNNRYHLDDDG